MCLEVYNHIYIYIYIYNYLKKACVRQAVLDDK